MNENKNERNTIKHNIKISKYLEFPKREKLMTVIHHSDGTQRNGFLFLLFFTFTGILLVCWKVKILGSLIATQRDDN